MTESRSFSFKRMFAWAAFAFISLHSVNAEFVHPGALSTQKDLDRIASKVAAGESPWIESWDILVNNTNRFMQKDPEPQEQINAGRGGGSENYMRLARASAKAYQLALRYQISGESEYADKAVEIFNAWTATHHAWGGDTNIRLRAGLYGYQFACAAELLRDYPAWHSEDLKAFQNYLLTQFVPHNQDFLENRHGTVPDHYWANWVHANMASLMAIGVFCDRRDLFDEGIGYFYNGPGNGNIRKAVNFIHPNGLGQWQESGRDQGHTLLGPQLLGVICEIAWNQGVDLYGYDHNRFLAGVEYISKYNLGHEVPFVVYVREWKHPGRSALDINDVIDPRGRGALRSGWDMIYNHYVNRRGIAAPYTKAYAE